MNQRLSAFFKKLHTNKLDGFFASNESNVSYLCGLKARDSFILISDKNKIIITDFRYTREFKNKAPCGFNVLQYKNLFSDISSLIKKLKIKRLGFESKSLAFAEHAKLKELLPPKVKLIDTFNFIEDIRKIKDALELTYIKKAVEITASAFDFAGKQVKQGLTEAELVFKLENFIRLQGADKKAFDFIIASGKHSSYPHAQITNKKILPDEPVIVDIGVEVYGYKSDLTRVFFSDKIKPYFKRIYNAVYEAQAQAIQAIRPGIQISEIDKLARKCLSGYGLNKYFGHSLGHGVGLDIHEEPSINPENKSLIQQGMVFTIEPGVYLPERFGVRLEDMVYVTKKGAEVLSGVINKSI